MGLSQSYPNVFENPRGYAFVLNIKNFNGRPKLSRDGSENDFKNLQDVLDELGYKVFPYEDLTLEVRLYYILITYTHPQIGAEGE